MDSSYALQFLNRSTNTGALCLFAFAEPSTVSMAEPVVWATLWARPGAWASLRWQDTWTFVWEARRQLSPGLVSAQGEARPARLEEGDRVRLDADDEGPFFRAARRRTPRESLVIEVESTLSAGEARVGVGLGGRLCFALDARPNATLSFQLRHPAPAWRLYFGDARVGDPVGPLERQSATVLSFPTGEQEMTATLNLDNTLTVTPGLAPMLAEPFRP